MMMRTLRRFKKCQLNLVENAKIKSWCEKTVKMHFLVMKIQMMFYGHLFLGAFVTKESFFLNLATFFTSTMI
jgi:hypothetical protein